MSSIPVSEIPTVKLLYKLGRLQQAKQTTDNATSKYNDKICLIRTDITKLETDAIVNAANESLLGGAGVDGAIHGAAGPELIRECKTLDGCDTGDAKITGAYRLPSKKVIHAVGPVYSITKRRGMHTALLQGCYTRSLDLAVQNNCSSIAFSALSTGVYGYPSEEAAETAIGAVKQWLDQDEERSKKMQKIVFCTFMVKDERAYEHFIPQFFPAAEANNEETSNVGGTSTGVAEETPGEAETSANSNALNLPDPPTKEPVEQGQPEAKKRKRHSQVDDAKAREAFSRT